MSGTSIGKTISALLLLVLIAFSAFTVSAFAGKDLSHPGSDLNKTLTASDIIEQYTGIAVSSDEREFLDKYATLKVTYNNIVTTDRVNVTYSDSHVIVAAEAYSYKSSGGGVFNLSPVAVEIGDDIYPLESGKAEIAVSGVSSLSVIYEGDVEISAEELSYAMSLYYDTASYVSDKDGYEAAYNAYLSYVVEKRIYDEALAKYNKYLESYDLYLTQKAEYESYDERLAQYKVDYEAYLEYKAKMQQLDAQIKKYEAYTEKMSTVTYQLKNFELINKKMTDNRSIYSAVMGGAVDQVLENEDAIVGFFGVKREIVVYAGIATTNVRTYMTEYNALETESEKYNYYIANYKEISKNFHLLAKTLDKLYQNNGVKEMIRTMEREEKYLLLVCQLAHISNLLIDGDVKNYDGNAVYNESWTINGRTIKDVLGSDNMYDDTDNGAPLTDGYPSAVEKPDVPPEVAEPEKPTKPALPVEPAAVNSPGEAPDEVSEPAIPTPANSQVANLDLALDSADRLRIKEAYSSGYCPKRTPATDAYTLKISTKVNKNKDAEQFEVKFVNNSGAILYKAFIEEGSCAVYEGIIPYKATDSDGSYTFGGWYEFREDGDYSNSEKFSLATPVTGDLTLVPAFDRLPTYYTVKWIINETVISKSYISGEVPQCPIAPEKSDNGSVGYRFVGWDKPIGVLHSDDEYVAVFEEYYLVTVGSGGATVKDDGDTYIVSAVGAYGAEFDLGNILERASGKRALKINTTSGVIDFSFAEVIKLKELGACKCSFVSVYNPKEGRYKFVLNLMDSSGAALECDVEAVITAPVNRTTFEGFTVSYVNENEVYRVPYSVAEGMITFSAAPNVTYEFAAEFDILPICDANITLDISATSALPGTKIFLSYELKDGYEISGFALTDSAGNSISVGADGSFIMPSSDVLLAIYSVQKIYTVRFSANGIVLSSVEHKWGEIPVPPTAPSIAADEEYSYTFEGWSSEILPVTEDVTYEAVYRSDPIIKEQTSGIKLSPKIKKLFIAGVSVLSVIIVGLATLITVKIVRKKKRNDPINVRRKFNRKKT